MYLVNPVNLDSLQVVFTGLSFSFQFPVSTAEFTNASITQGYNVITTDLRWVMVREKPLKSASKFRRHMLPKAREYDFKDKYFQYH